MKTDFDAYLDAKRDLDERSIHGPTWTAYISSLERLSAETPQGVPSVLELGAGLGAMLERTIRDFGGGLAYLALDASVERLEVLRRRFEAGPRGKRPIGVETRRGDALEEMEKLASAGRRFDAVVSHAFIDLVDIPRLAAAAARLLVSGGVFYNSLVFDGVTAFLSAVPTDPEEDGRYVETYHRSMRRPWNGRMPQGESAGEGAGGRILALATRPPWTVLSAGPSDWILPPRGKDRTAAGSAEEKVVARMLGFFQESVGTPLAGRDREDFSSWLERKRTALRDGGLGYYAHNLDVLAALRDKG